MFLVNRSLKWYKATLNVDSPTEFKGKCVYVRPWELELDIDDSEVECTHEETVTWKTKLDEKKKTGQIVDLCGDDDSVVPPVKVEGSAPSVEQPVPLAEPPPRVVAVAVQRTVALKLQGRGIQKHRAPVRAA